MSNDLYIWRAHNYSRNVCASLSSGTRHHNVCLLTLSWSLGKCEGILSWEDVNLVICDFVHHGGLVYHPAGFEGVQIQPTNKHRGTTFGTVVLWHSEYAACTAPLYLLWGVGHYHRYY